MGPEQRGALSQDSQLGFKPMGRQDVFEIRALDGETASIN